VKVSLLIVYDTSTRQVEITGPIEDAVTFCGMLRLAEIAFAEHRASKRAIFVPGTSLPPPPRAE